ncbi:hypothetical protein ACEPPN_006726 [Leptodophora sp. 'Broadleaf-Isolate-01']
MPEIHINLAQPTAAPVPQSAPHLPAQPYQYSHHNTFGSYGLSQGPHSYIPGYPEHQFPHQNQGQRHPLGRSFNAGAPSSPLQPTSDRVSHLEDFRDWLIVRDQHNRGDLILQEFPAIIDGGYSLDQCHDATGLIRAGVKGGIAMWIADHVSEFKGQRKTARVLQNLSNSGPPPQYNGQISGQTSGQLGASYNPNALDDGFFEGA